MLTPKKIKGYQFQSAGRGCYKAGEVDEFFAQVVESYDQVFRENGELVRKMGLLATKLEEYRKDEDNIRRALMNAQRMADKVVEEARAESERIISEAQARAKNADYTTNAKIKVMVDEVEAQMRVAFEKATAQAVAVKQRAQKESEKILTDAKLKAESMIDSATKLSKENLDQILKDIETEKTVLNCLKEDSNSFKAELKARYNKQLEDIDRMPDYVVEKLAKELTEEEDEKSVLSEADREEVTRLVDSFVAGQADSLFDSEDFFSQFDYGALADHEEVIEAVEEPEEKEIEPEQIEAEEAVQPETPDVSETADDMYQDIFSFSVPEEMTDETADAGDVSFDFDEDDDDSADNAGFAFKPMRILEDQENVRVPDELVEFDFDDDKQTDSFSFRLDDSAAQFDFIKNDETASVQEDKFKDDKMSEPHVDDDGSIYIGKRPSSSSKFDAFFNMLNEQSAQKDEKEKPDTDKPFDPKAANEEIAEEPMPEMKDDEPKFSGFSINIDGLDDILEDDEIVAEKLDDDKEFDIFKGYFDKK